MTQEWNMVVMQGWNMVVMQGWNMVVMQGWNMVVMQGWNIVMAQGMNMVAHYGMELHTLHPFLLPVIAMHIESPFLISSWKFEEPSSLPAAYTMNVVDQP